MKLDRIHISNFRSIKEQIIKFTNNCLIFVGDNAAGKSNVLKAIVGGITNSEDDYLISPKDKRKRLPKEPPIEPEKYFIRYVFSISASELDSILENIDVAKEKELFSVNGNLLSYKDFVYAYFSEGLWCYNISKNEAFPSTLKINDDITVVKNLYRVDTAFTTDDGKNIEPGTIIHTANEHTGPAMSLDDYKDKIVDAIKEFIRSNLPHVYYWKYDKNQLLPTTISIEEFSKNPNSCEPLRNIFKLAGYMDIKQAFEEARAEDGHVKNLLNNVSAAATESFASKWAHFKDVEICLSPDGTNMLITVKRKAEFSMEEESDGFKRFISILLLLSTRVDTKDIANSLIVIDEPDNSLSPSGCRDLRDLLIQMSDNNIVIYSTHSPFMVDNKNIGRHIIVERDPKTDVTNLTIASDNEYEQNEVLLHAIGTSVFDFISDINILFEGWGDSKVFKTALNAEKYKNIINKFKKIGVSFAHGCTGIRYITPALSFIKNKKIIIFTDSDESSLNAKTHYVNNHGYQSENWFSFEDLGGDKDETIEDYLSHDFLAQALVDIGSDIDIKAIGNKKVMQFLKDLPNKEQFKEYIYKNVKPEHIKSEYFTVILKSLSEKLA